MFKVLGFFRRGAQGVWARDIECLGFPSKEVWANSIAGFGVLPVFEELWARALRAQGWGTLKASVPLAPLAPLPPCPLATLASLAPLELAPFVPFAPLDPLVACLWGKVKWIRQGFVFGAVRWLVWSLRIRS